MESAGVDIDEALACDLGSTSVSIFTIVFPRTLPE
jgi:hypothetical protein